MPVKTLSNGVVVPAIGTPLPSPAAPWNVPISLCRNT